MKSKLPSQEIENWTKINQDFAIKVENKTYQSLWTMQKFTKSQAQQYLGQGFFVQDFMFLTWLRDNKRLIIPLLSEKKIARLRNEYNQCWVKLDNNFGKKIRKLENTYQQIWEEFGISYDWAKQWIELGKNDANQFRFICWPVYWIKHGFLLSETANWLESGFKINDYQLVKKWKNCPFRPDQVRTLISIGLGKNEHLLASYIQEKYRKKNPKPRNLDIEKLRIEFHTNLLAEEAKRIVFQTFYSFGQEENEIASSLNEQQKYLKALLETNKEKQVTISLFKKELEEMESDKEKEAKEEIEKISDPLEKKLRERVLEICYKTKSREEEIKKHEEDIRNLQIEEKTLDSLEKKTRKSLEINGKVIEERKKILLELETLQNDKKIKYFFWRVNYFLHKASRAREYIVRNKQELERYGVTSLIEEIREREKQIQENLERYEKLKEETEKEKQNAINRTVLEVGEELNEIAQGLDLADFKELITEFKKTKEEIEHIRNSLRVDDLSILSQISENETLQTLLERPTQQELDQLKSDKDDLENKLNSKNSDLASLQEELTNQKNSFTALTAEKENFVKNVQILTSEKTKLEQTLNEVQQTNSKLEEKLVKSEQSFAGWERIAESYYQTSQQELKKNKQTHKEAETNLSQLQTQLNQSYQESSNLREGITIEKEENNSLKSKFSEQASELTKERENKQTLQNRLIITENDLLVAKEEIINKETKINELETSLTSKNEVITSLEEQLAAEQAKNITSDSSAEKLAAEKEALTKKITELENEIKLANEQAEDFGQELDEADGKIRDLKNETATLNDQLRDKDGDLESKDKRIDELSESLNNVTADAALNLEKKDQTIAELNRQLGEEKVKSAGISALEEEIEQLSSQFENLQIVLENEQQNHIQTKQELKEKLNARPNITTEDWNNANQQIKNLTDKLEAAENTLNKEKQIREKTEQELNKYQQQLIQQGKTIINKFVTGLELVGCNKNSSVEEVIKIIKELLVKPGSNDSGIYFDNVKKIDLKMFQNLEIAYSKGIEKQVEQINNYQELVDLRQQVIQKNLTQRNNQFQIVSQEKIRLTNQQQNERAVFIVLLLTKLLTIFFLSIKLKQKNYSKSKEI